MELSTVVERLDERLSTAEYADLDASANGLQVGSREGTVDHAAFAVDAARSTIETAAQRDADLLVAHHGLSWGGIERVTGTHYDRIAPLVEADLALYVSHLPLDGHQQLGNAAGLADLLELTDCEPFGSVGPQPIGQRGRTPETLDPTTLRETLSEGLDTGGSDVRLLDFGPDEIREVAIVTGSGTDWLDEAVDVGADVLITGEGKQKVYHEAKDVGINVVLAGHYATETFGVRSLQSLVGDWGVETSFVAEPTGI